MDERFIAFFLWVNSTKIPLTILLKKADNHVAVIIRSLNLHQRNYLPMYLLSM